MPIKRPPSLENLEIWDDVLFPSFQFGTVTGMLSCKLVGVMFRLTIIIILFISDLRFAILFQYQYEYIYVEINALLQIVNILMKILYQKKPELVFMSSQQDFYYHPLKHLLPAPSLHYHEI